MHVRISPKHALILPILLIAASFLLQACGTGTAPEAPSAFDVEAHYTKSEVRIPMRDGVELFATVYVPRDTTRSYPFLVKRTPYSSGPYEAGEYLSHVGPNGTPRFAEDGYIFVYQDVRGRFMSEGTFTNMTPNYPGNGPETPVDESSDMYDTVEWLLENVHPNNGKVGLWGISYPGFYAAASVIDSHPAIRASSPQAPIGDWFKGDDFHHNGAFFLQDAFRFFYRFDHVEPTPTTARREPAFDFGTDSAYEFFLDLGPVKNANERYFKNQVPSWDSLMTHGTYDAYWQDRNIIPHMKNVTSPMLTVAGLFDAEDPYGPISIYASTEANNPGLDNKLVLGPWFHGGWVRADGDSLGAVSFGTKTSLYYQDRVDLAWFNEHLKEGPPANLPEVLAYASGDNVWREFDAWPPESAAAETFYFGEGGTLATAPPDNRGQYEWVSDPANPVPYTGERSIRRSREYMVEDQRFVADREDVLTFSAPEQTDVATYAGPVSVELFVETTGTDADFVVKIIDEYPDGFQMLVRAEVFRGKFRNSMSDPEPFLPGKVARVAFDTPHILHTFQPGHKLVVQVQSSWFPLVDMNPQTFTDIYSATETDFREATHTLHHGQRYASGVTLLRLDE